MAWRDKLNRLNGWQRLWLVLSVLWLIFTGIGDFSWGPKTYECPSGWTLEGTLCFPAPQIELPEELTTPEQDLKAPQKLKIPKEFTTPGKRPVVKTDWPAFAGVFIVMGIIPAACVYVLGMAIGWIIKGFKKAEPKS
jgi:hypothetical protein